MDEAQTQVKMPRKAKAILNRMLQTKQITSGGLNWLIAATDPFHDAPLECTGFPDANQCNSLVQTIQRATNLKKPSGVSETWDAHIFLNPATPSTAALVANGAIDNKYYRHTLSQIGEVVLSSVQSRPLYGGYNAIACEAGQDWTTTASGATNSDTDAISLPISYCGGQFRLVAAAVEVVNTTAALYQSGACTAYRVPSVGRQALIHHYGLPTDSNAQVITLPPGTQDQAILMPSSRTWSATAGAYSVGCLNSINNPLQVLAGRTTILVAPPLTGVQLSTNGSNNLRGAYTHRAYVTPPGTTPLAEPYNSATVFPFDVSGIIFTGLHPETSLQVTVKYLMERIPTYSETDLVSLTRPPPGYDPIILELYSRVMSDLPVGVTVDENPLGEWFWDILKGVEVVAPLIGTALAPLTGGVSEVLGMGASALAGTGLAMRPPPDPTATKKKQKQQKQPQVEEISSQRHNTTQTRKPRQQQRQLPHIQNNQYALVKPKRGLPYKKRKN